MTADCPDRGCIRVGILDHTASLGGGEIALLNLARCIDPRRFKVIVVLFGDGPLRNKLEEAGIATLIVPLDPRIGMPARTASVRGRCCSSAK